MTPELAGQYSTAIENTPGFIDMSFVNRGYEKTDILTLPATYRTYHHYRNLADRVIDESFITVNLYADRIVDDSVSHIRSAERKNKDLDRMAKVYLRKLQTTGAVRNEPQEDIDNFNAHATPEEITTGPIGDFGHEVQGEEDITQQQNPDSKL